MTSHVQKLRLFIRETKVELLKATWPTWKELKESIVVVLFASFILGLLIFISDYSFFEWVSFLSNLVKPVKAA